MKVLSLKEKNNVKAYIALGFFDCVHSGHKTLIDCAVSEAKKFGCQSAVFTFANNPYKFIKSSQKLIFNFDERLELFEECGVDCVLYADFDKAFSEIHSDDFLKLLSESVALKGVVCGTDYRFGAKAEGDAQYLSTYCNNNGIMCDIIPQKSVNSLKISSTLIRNKIECGYIEEANKLLGHTYFIVGNVCHGRGVGKIYDFPTANISYSDDKLLPQRGVYATLTKVDGVVYRSVTNVGNKPTFDENTESVETMLCGFDGDLYGKKIKVEFLRRLRDIQKFESPVELKKQIYSDAEWRI